MTGNYPFLGSSMPENKACPVKTPVEIDARGIYYRQLNEKILQVVEEGARHVIVRNVRGQRYLAAGLSREDLLLEIHGVPGEDLGFNMNGPTVKVFGHGQNAVANTMDSGQIIIHGLGGDALAYGMRGGKLFVRDDVGYRVGIHMKEYQEKIPLVVVGGTSGDYLGEYMAGGVLILLNKDNERDLVVGNADRTLATGIHGGVIYIYGYEVPSYLLGIGAVIREVEPREQESIEKHVLEFCRHFALEAPALLDRSLVKIQPAGSRPFAKFYSPAYPVDTGLKPQWLEKTSPCEASCPAGVPTSRFLRHLRHGENEAALALLDEVTPFRYSCCGFICPHLCMEGCTRSRVDFPVRTADLARRFKSELLPSVEGPRPEKIAVVGAGPSGLSAAYQLVRKGYGVTVFDEAEHPGGKLYQVISRTRLPLEDLEHDLARIAKLGVRMEAGRRVDREKFEEILRDYDHVVVAVGAHRPVMPPVEGVEHLSPGLDFLKAYNRQKMSAEGPALETGDRAVVIGGGDAAVDGIEALIDLGVKPGAITVVDIQKPSANPQERRKLEQMGVLFRYPLFLQEATSRGAWVADGAGRREFLPADKILVFINEQPVLDFLPAELQEQRDKRGFYPVKEDSFRTSHPKISIVGDACNMGLVTTNIGKGRQCAQEIHAVLQEEDYLPESKDLVEPVCLHPERALPLAEGELDIEEEYDRCLHCGICVQCDSCVEACPRQALTRENDQFEVDLSRCGGCGTCAASCLGGVIRMVRK